MLAKKCPPLFQKCKKTQLTFAKYSFQETKSQFTFWVLVRKSLLKTTFDEVSFLVGIEDVWGLL